LNITATDETSGINTCEYTIDSAGYFLLTKSGDTYSALPSIYNGPHTVSFRCTDNAGRQATLSSIILFTVDTAAPTISAINSPTAYANYSSSSVSLSITASDGTGSGINVCQYSDNGGAYVSLSGTGPYTATPAFSEGFHILSFRCTDNAGLNSAISSVSFRVDTAAPTISAINSPTAYANYSSSSVSLSITASDGTGSGINVCQYSDNGELMFL